MQLVGRITRVIRSPALTLNGWCVFCLAPEAGGEITAEEIKCSGSFRAAREGIAVRLTGTIVSHPHFGDEFKASQIHLASQSREVSLSDYLASLSPDLPPPEARRIIKYFGAEHLASLLDRRDTHSIAKAPLNFEVAEELANRWHQAQRQYDLMHLCHNLGLASSDIERVVDHYTHTRKLSQATREISDNPFALQAVLGPKFSLLEYVSRRTGASLVTPERIDSAINDIFNRAGAAGHCFLHSDYVVERCLALCNRDIPAEAHISTSMAESRLALMCSHNTLTTIPMDGRLLLAPADIATAEREIAAQLKRLQASKPTLSPPPPEDIDAALTGFVPTEHQSAAIDMALNNKVSILTGEPGTGKTAITSVILKAFPENAKICLLAPTGQASERIAESTGRPAHTIHRALGIQPDGTGQSEMLDADIVIVDEMSMVDVALARRTLAGVPDHARLIMVGDPEQLPSIGPGAVLRDLICSPIPHTHLSQIVRQKQESGIIQAAASIRKGLSPFRHSWFKDDCQLVPAVDEDESGLLIVNMVRSLRAREVPADDIQVLVPWSYGPCGTTALNKTLRPWLNDAVGDPANRAPLGIHKSDVWLGDRVRHRVNDYQTGLMNGMVGEVCGFDKRTLKVKFENQVYPFDPGTARQLQLDYASTIHRSQGSQFPITILGICKAHLRMLDRRLLYTAVTRAEQMLIAIGEPAAYKRAAAKSPNDARQTLLAEYLGEPQLQLEHQPALEIADGA